MSFLSAFRKMILFLNLNLSKNVFVKNEHRFSENLAKSPQSQISVWSQIKSDSLKLYFPC